MKRLFLLAVGLFVFEVLSAQKTADIGIWGGIGSYTGDMTEIEHQSSLGPAGAVFVRYNFNPRESVRATIMLGNINATGAFESHPWEFSKTVTDLSLMYEFNFFRYIMGSKKHWITTYLMGGLGVSVYPYEYDPVALTGVVAYLNASAPALPPEYADAYKETVTGVNIPLGFGFKFNIGERMAVGMEAQLRKYLDDRMDNLDDPRKFYTEGPTNSGAAGYWTTYTDAIHNNDWTFHLGIHVTYLFYRGGKKCPAYDEIN